MTNAQEKGSGCKVRSLFPILTWLSNYNLKDIRYDVIPGFRENQNHLLFR